MWSESSLPRLFVLQGLGLSLPVFRLYVVWLPMVLHTHRSWRRMRTHQCKARHDEPNSGRAYWFPRTRARTSAAKVVGYIIPSVLGSQVDRIGT
jgi:hypothetical protein